MNNRTLKENGHKRNRLKSHVKYRFNQIDNVQCAEQKHSTGATIPGGFFRYVSVYLNLGPRQF